MKIKFAAALLPIFSFALFACTALASELTGHISIGPWKLGQEQVVPGSDSGHQSANTAAGAVILPIVRNKTVQEENSTATIKSGSKVLGFKQHPDFSLLRSSNKKIYLICAGAKKHILNLTELRKYRGRAIHEVDSGYLDHYQTKGYLDNDLIRCKGDSRVYIIKNGKKQHIKTLKELGLNYSGREIFNLKKSEFDDY